MQDREAIITRAGGGIKHAHAGGAVSVTALSAAQHPGGSAVQIAEMPVGSGPPFHRHPAFDEVFIILEGTVEFQVRDELHVAHAGDLVFVPGELPHAPRCTAGNDRGVALLVMLVTPARFEDFFHELGDLLARPHTRSELESLGREYGIEFLERPDVRTTRCARDDEHG